MENYKKDFWYLLGRWLIGAVVIGAVVIGAVVIGAVARPLGRAYLGCDDA